MSESSNISNNSGPGSAAEPSMEEILASIRRILKEDDSGSTFREDPEDDELVLSSAMVAVPADISTATELPAETGMLGARDEPPASAYDEPVHFVSQPEIDTHVYEAAPLPAAPEPELEEAPITLSAAPEPEPEPVAAAPLPAEPEPEPVAAEPEPELEPEPVASAPQQAAPIKEEKVMEQHVQAPDGLIGDAATSAIASTVGQLMRSITTDRSVAVSRHGLTIEDIVREEIKPMLKAWFDSHLPSLVERIVRAEIGRVIDRMEL